MRQLSKSDDRWNGRRSDAERLITNRYPHAQVVEERGGGQTFGYRFATNGTVLPISVIVDRKAGKARFERP